MVLLLNLLKQIPWGHLVQQMVEIYYNNLQYYTILSGFSLGNIRVSKVGLLYNV